MSALNFATRHINASASTSIDPATLLDVMQSGVTPVQWQHHLFAFFDETDVETLSDLVGSGAITYAQLADGARRHLPAGHDTRRWLDERA